MNDVEELAGHSRRVDVLVFAGSLRRESINARLASLAARLLADQGASVDLAELATFDCPSYDQDVEDASGIPEGAVELRDRLEAVDAFVIASPEYNGSVPGVLKNVIDWTSRHRPQPFNGRSCLLLSASPSMVGGNRGLWSLRVPLEHLGARVHPDMFSLAKAHEALDDDGGLVNETLHARLRTMTRSFLDVVEATKHYPSAKKAWIEFPGEEPSPATSRAE